MYSEEFQHANPQDIVNLCFDLYRKHWNTWFFVDGADRAAVNLMKVAFNESLNWESSKQSISPNSMKILPVNFATEHKQMLAQLAMLLSKEYLAIPKEYDKLIISLRTAWALGPAAMATVAKIVVLFIAYFVLMNSLKISRRKICNFYLTPGIGEIISFKTEFREVRTSHSDSIDTHRLACRR